jgi:hypothetical protein
MNNAGPFPNCSLPPGGRVGRGSEPTCVGLDGRSVCRVSRQTARSAQGAP